MASKDDVAVLSLQKVAAAVSVKLRGKFLRALAESLEGSVYEQVASDDVLFQFTALVNGSGNRVCVVQYPEDWWQHFKQRWFPEWAKRRWPVKHRKVTYERFAAMCPHVHVADPKTHLTFLYDAERNRFEA